MVKRFVAILPAMIIALAGPASAQPSLRETIELTDLSSVAISPDQRWAVYRAEVGSVERNDYALDWYVVALDGRSPPRRVADAGAGDWPDGMIFSQPPIWSPDSSWFYWNASASAPRGLYLVRPGAMPSHGDYVVARLSRPMRDLAARRRYLPANVPLVKRVAARAGDQVCAYREIIVVGGRPVARRLKFDAAGRPMPQWSGCSTLGRADFFLLMTDSQRSFDGRYFGATRADQIVGRATLLWAR